MKKSLLILGAGQYGVLAGEIASSMGCFDRISFLDDRSSLAIGGLSDCEKLLSDYSCAFVAIGNPAVRTEWMNRLAQLGYELAVLISPQAYVSPSAQLSCGCIVESNASVNTGAFLGRGVIVSSGAVINHNAVIGDACHIDCCAAVEANANVPDATKVISCTFFKRVCN